MGNLLYPCLVVQMRNHLSGIGMAFPDFGPGQATFSSRFQHNAHVAAVFPTLGHRSILLLLSSVVLLQNSTALEIMPAAIVFENGI